MADWTADDAARIRAAIASGNRTVRLADGRMLERRSIAELREALALVEDDLAQQAGMPPVRRLVPRLTRGLGI